MRYFVFVSLLAVTFGGKIVPKTSLPIKPRYNNQSISSDYEFKFQIETYMPENSVLKIYFPSYDYVDGLGIGTCAAQDERGLSYSCSVSQTTVTVQLGERSNSPSYNTHTLIIKNVQNPVHTGATGQFRLETYLGINLLDYNDMFGQVGIFGDFLTFTSATVSCSKNCEVGEIGTYLVSFQVPSQQSAQTVLKIKFASQLNLLSYIPCTSLELPSIYCDVDEDKNVTVFNFNTNLLPTVTYNVVFSEVQNPDISVALDSFTMDLMNQGANNIIYRTTGISAGNINANVMKNLRVCPNLNDSACQVDFLYIGKSTASISNKYEYTITGTTTNNIPANGVLQISVPAQLTVSANSCVIVSGFSNLGTSVSEQVRCVVSGNTLEVQSFSRFAKGSFEVMFEAANPQTSGTTSDFTVTSYSTTAKTYSIDVGTATGISISNIAPPTAWSASPVTSGGRISLEIQFQPVSNNVSSLFVRFPESFGLNGQVSTSYLKSGESAPDSSSGTYWNALTGELTISFPSGKLPSSAGSNSLTVSTSTGTGFTQPAESGEYLVEYILRVGNTEESYVVSGWVVSPDTLTVSVTPISLDINRPTVYRVAFTPTTSVPQGVVTSDINATYGKIEIKFPTQNSSGNNLFQLDLGTGYASGSSVPCIGIGGLQAASGSEITCTITNAASASSSNYVTIQVLNFKAISINTSCTLDIPTIYNTQTGGISADISVTIYSVRQGNPNAILGKTVTVSGYYDDANPVLPPYNGRSPASLGGDGTNTISLSSVIAGEGATVSLILWPETTLTTSNGSLIVKFPAGFTIVKDNVQCFLDYSILLACTGYPTAGWVGVRNIPQALTLHNEYTLVISGVSNPSNTGTLSGLEITYILNQQETEYSVYSDFYDMEAGGIVVEVTADSYQASAVDTTYTWFITPSNNLEETSKIQLTFPENDYVLTTTPALECSISGGLSAKSTADPISCVFDSNTVIISNYAAYTAGGAIVVKIEHILNPSERVETGKFTIETLTSGGIIKDANYDIKGLEISRRDDYSTIIHNEFYSDPDNGGYTTKVVISFTPTDIIAAKSEIEILLPNGDFSGLSGNLDCDLSGGIENLDSCTGNGNMITLVNTFEYSNLSMPITLAVYGLTNFTGGITSDLVSIRIKYSNTIYQESTLDDANRSYTTSLAPDPLSIRSFQHTPLTASEQSSFSFDFQLTNTLQPTCTLNIQFPSNIPRDLGAFLQCSSEKLGKVSCWAEGRTLVIQGSQSYTPTQTEGLAVTAGFILNPNMGLAMDTLVAYTKCGLTMIDYGTLEIQETSSAYADFLQFTQINIGDNKSLQDTSYSLTVSLNTVFAGDSTDRVYVYFPMGYDQQYVGSGITCESAQTSGADVCQYQNNRISISGFDGSDLTAVKSYSFTLNGVENPSDSGEARYPELALFDSETKQIIAKTLSNLNLVSSPNYSKPGSEIVINYGKTWDLTKGSRSKTLHAVVSNGAPQKAELSANLPAGVTITPYPITLNSGDQVATFQMTANQQARSGTYTIDWTNTGDWETSPYTLISRSTFTITDSDKELITVDFNPIIPFGGHTLPIAVELSRSPTTLLQVRVVKLTDKPNRLFAAPAVLEFYPGDTKKYFRLSVDNSNVGYDGQVFIYADGEDKDAYQFEQQVFDIEVGRPDTVDPIVHEYHWYGSTRTSASFSVDLSEIVDIYYMVALRGTREPTVKEVLGGFLEDSENLTVAPIFGNSHEFELVREGVYRVDWTVLGLTAQTDYVLYAYPQDLGSNGADIISIEFRTQNRYKTATFTLKFLDRPLTEFFVNDSLRAISEILKIDIDRVAFRTDYNAYSFQNIEEISDFSKTDLPDETTSSGGRHQGGRQLVGYTKLDYLLFPDPTDTNTATPLSLVNQLQYRKFQLKQELSLLDTSAEILGYELISDVPTFISEPKLADTQDQQVTIEDLALSSPGWIYVCLVQDTGVQPKTPTSYQVYTGFDSNNDPCLVTENVQYTGTSQKLTLQLDSSVTDYWVYIAGTNSMERYRDPGEEVKVLGFSTNPDADDDDDFQGALKLAALVVITLIV